MNRHKLITALLACACGVFSFCEVAGFAKYVPISVSGYSGVALSDFPVLIKIDASSIPGIYSDVKHSGADLKFTDDFGDGDYPYEVDTWDPTGTSYVWVKLPSFASGVNFRMYYGDNAKTTNPSAADVWMGYKGVWHLNTGLADSVAGGDPAVAVSPTQVAAGAIGSGCKISSESVTSGSKTGAVYCPSTASVDYSQGFTISVWMNNISYSSTWDDQMILATCSGVWEKKGGFCIRANTWPNSGKEMMFSNSNCNDKFQNSDSRVPPLWDDNVWHLFSMVWDGSSLGVFIDGVAGNTSSRELTNSGEPLTFGNCSNLDRTKIGTTDSSAFSWKGGVDECRLTTAVKSADWLRAEYLVVSQDVTTFGEPYDLSVCTVDFSAVGERSGSAPLVVEFQASSEGFSGTVTYKWDFDNDGVVDLTTTDVRFSRVFNDRGAFSVRVSAEDASGHTATKLVKDYILVGGEVYVDANAVSEGFGTKASPFKTITNAVAKAIGRDTIYVRGGFGCSYRFADYRDSVRIAVPGLKIRGCDADWNPAGHFTETNSMARIVIADDYAAKSFTLKGNKTEWPAPFEIEASDTVISGLYAEFGPKSYKQQDKGGEGMISISGGISDTVVENCWFQMTSDHSGYDCAGSYGLISGIALGNNTSPLVKDTVVRRCYVRMGKYRGGIALLGDLHDGTRLEECLIERLDTLYVGHNWNNIGDVNYYVVSNIFLNCSGGDPVERYHNWFFYTAGNGNPSGGEIAYNRFIRNLPADPNEPYRLFQHGRQYLGCWKEDTVIHHNTIVGYDIVFESPGYSGNQTPGSMWRPKIFDNLILESGAVFSETANAKWPNGSVECCSSFMPESMFMKNAVMADDFVIGPATVNAWYDIGENLAGTNTTIQLDAMPPFVNTTDPLSENYYRLKVPQAPWVIDAWVGDDPSFPDPNIPRYIGAVAPQPGGFAVRIR